MIYYIARWWTILNILDGCHGEITLNGLDDCKLEDVITKIARLFRIDDISRISFWVHIDIVKINSNPLQDDQNFEVDTVL